MFFTGYGNEIELSGASGGIPISTKCKPLPKIETPWRFKYIQKKGADGNTFYYYLVDTTQVGQLIKLNAGETYVLLTVNQELRYLKDPNFSVSDLTEAHITNLRYAGYDPTPYKRVDGRAGTFLSMKIYSIQGGLITPEQDIWLVVNAHDNNTDGLYEVYKQSEIEYLENLSGSEIVSFSNKTQNIYANPFDFISGQHKAASPAYFERHSTDERMRRLIRQTDWLDSLALSNFHLCFIGDSITYAASNAGLQRAFRKMVPYKLQVVNTTNAISGTCMTNGFGYDWQCGVSGVDGLLSDASYIQTVPDSPFDRPHIFIIALGTNDYANDAPLGDVEAEDRDTTFAGCYLKLIEAIRANYPKSGIILMCPFNREVTTANKNGNILLDYCRVIHEIASFTPHTWVLDLSNHPLINHAGYSTGFVDYVHISKYGHAVVSNELYRLIMEIVAVSGFDYLPCLDNLNVGL